MVVVKDYDLPFVICSSHFISLFQTTKNSYGSSYVGKATQHNKGGISINKSVKNHNHSTTCFFSEQPPSASSNQVQHTNPTC
jgi:hypothetical protein